MLIFFGILIIALGIFTILKPAFGWQWNEGWKVKGESEPSESYISFTKFGGIVTIVLGSFLLIYGLLPYIL